MMRRSKNPPPKCLSAKKPYVKRKYEYNSKGQLERLTVPSTFPLSLEDIAEPRKRDIRNKKIPFVAHLPQSPTKFTPNQNYYRSPSDPDPTAKSIFREINEKYERLVLRNQRQIPQRDSITPSCSTDSRSNHIHSQISNPKTGKLVPNVWTDNNFSLNLSKNIKVEFKQNSLTKCLRNIKKQIFHIDSIISGDRKSFKRSAELVSEEMESQNEKENVVEYKLLPKCMWVYKTPKKQKIGKPVLGASSLKPALMERTNQGQSSALFELKHSQNFNLNRYKSGHSVSIDMKYLQDSNERRRNHCRGERPADILEESSYFEPVIEQPSKKTKTLRKYNSSELFQRGNIFENYEANQSASESLYFDPNSVTFAPLCTEDQDNNKRLFSVEDFDTPNKRKKMFNFQKSPTLFNFSNMNHFNV